MASKCELYGTETKLNRFTWQAIRLRSFLVYIKTKMNAALMFIGGTALGIVIIRYPRWFYANVSRLPFFERYIGSGGGYSGWRLIGMLIIVGSWIAAFKYF